MTAPPLPEVFTLESVLSWNGTTGVLRARRRGTGADVRHLVLRIDTRSESAQTGSELAVLASVDHPGIAPLTDHGALPRGGSYVARPWVQGLDLLAWCEGRSPEEIGAAVARLTPALDHLHRRGFVHGDLKPENVVVDDQDGPVLCDFGLARPAAGRDEHGTADGVSGTLFSIAPELLLGLPPSPASDLFALGAMLHRLLAPARRSAQDFYAAFPEASFLDAMGTDPQALPAWARDLVARLTARAPERRPGSAAEVGRELAQRLGLELRFDSASQAPRWPVGQGREAWLVSWHRRVEAPSERPLWTRVPKLEDPRVLQAHLRVHAALRGRSSHGLDLGEAAHALRNAVELDEWAAARVREAWLLVLVRHLDPWTERALAALERAARTLGSGATSTVVVVSPEEPPDDAWDLLDVPPVDAESVARFLAAHLAGEEEARRAVLAPALAEAASGSATRLDGLLAGMAERGWLVFDDGSYRLRPGEVPDPRALGDPEATQEELEGLEPAQRALLDALEVCGPEADPDAVILCVDGVTGGGTRAFRELCADGWIAVDRSPLGRRIARRRRAPWPSGDPQQVRYLHHVHAQALGRAQAPEVESLVHRFCATTGSDRAEAAGTLEAELGRLRETGRAELALTALDRLRTLVRGEGVELEQAAPRLCIEQARAWAEIGRTELALEALAPLEGQAELAALLALVHARVEALRHRTDRALAAYARAAELDPGLAAEAAIGRCTLLHSGGRDGELRAALADFDPRAREARGELTTRWRIYLESLDAMSAHRLGDAPAAHPATEQLLGEAVALQDAGLEAALRINLALMERTHGSLSRAQEHLEQAIERYDRAGLVAGLAHARGTLGGLLRERGRLLDAEPLLVRAMETRLRLGDAEGASTMRGMLGMLHFERGHARAAIASLEGTKAAMTGAQRRRFGPLLATLAAEMRARLGDAPGPGVLPEGEAEADPRILLAKARIAWIADEAAVAQRDAQRAAELAESLGMERLAREARGVLAQLTGAAWAPRVGSLAEAEGLADLDELVLWSLAPETFEPERAAALATELEERGRDDRAARLHLALVARLEDEGRSRTHEEAARALLERLGEGLTEGEARALRTHLLARPDPWPSDLAPRARTGDEGTASEDVRLLLEVSRQLTREENLTGLLGAIVDHALLVSGAERGFLVLEEHGRLRFDTALDSCRGDVAQPEFEVSASIIQRSLEAMEPLRLSNAVDDPLVGSRTSVISLELRSVLCVPFEVNEHLRGAIYVDHRLRKGAFDRRAEGLCSLLAGQAAVAIQQVRRMEEIGRLNRELERRVVHGEADLRRARLALRRVGAEEPLADLVGDSKAMEEVRALLARLGATALPVLITGESGTGKELAARALHGLSDRRDGTFVSESCAALPPSLIESELFGYRRGAFTGADRDHAGLIEQAAGGTLFLDEIGELPFELQAKLLRVLETGLVRRLGDAEPTAVDFRLVTATNRDLELEVRENRFRSDLLYRINALRVRMPALAERREDVPRLARHFLHLEDPDGRARRIGPKVLDALMARPWPGNVRELRNEVARLAVLSDGDLTDASLVSAPAPSLAPAPGTADGHVLPLAELERRAIVHALEVTGGDKRRAAELLGISRAKVYQRLKEWREGEAAASR